MKVYCNKKTRVAHADGKRGDACRQSLSLRKNIVKFDGLSAALNSGYRACKRCKPE